MVEGNSPLIVGITGGIGAGKSLVADILARFGVPVYHADDRAKWLMSHDEQLRNGITALFGEEAYLSDGALNRSHISTLAFGNPDLLNQLNQLVHPATGRDFLSWVHAQGEEGKTVVAKEAAILFESGAYLACNQIISVYAPQTVRVARVMDRDGVSREDVLARIRRQWPEWKKLRRSDFFVINDGSHLLIPQVSSIVVKLRGIESREEK